MHVNCVVAICIYECIHTRGFKPYMKINKYINKSYNIYIYIYIYIYLFIYLFMYLYVNVNVCRCFTWHGFVPSTRAGDPKGLVGANSIVLTITWDIMILTADRTATLTQSSNGQRRAGVTHHRFHCSRLSR